MRALSTAHKLPPNPTYIEFTSSDGDPNRLPSGDRTRPIVDEEGCVNYLRPIDLDESTSIYWRMVIGAEAAKRLNYPSGPNYVLKSFPFGYNLYDHNKGPQESPRHDPYLIGGKTRYRSSAEFIPHAAFLLSGGTQKCECKYCTGRPQRVISFEMGLSQVRPSPTTVRNGRHRVRREKRSIASVRRIPEPVPQPTVKGPTNFVVPEREKDLRAFVHSTGSERHRWARRDELVWCGLTSPIKCPTPSNSDTSEDIAIHFWPGIVEEIRLRSKAVLKSDMNGVIDVQMSDGNNQATLRVPDRPSRPNTTNSSEDNNEDDVPWTIVQSTLYKIKLLAVSSDCLVPGSAIIPYQAYAPPNKLLEEIKTVKFSIDEFAKSTNEGEIRDMEDVIHKCFSQFQPFPVDRDIITDSSSRFRDAAGPFALAIQIASRFANYWAPLDEYKFKYTVPTTPTQANGTALSDSNIQNVAGPSSNNMTSEELEKLAGRVLGLRSRDRENPAVVVQSRYQGLWWGAERIWVDDLVRLKHPRYLVAPEGNKYIKKPAGYVMPKEPFNEGDTDLGAAGRGIFMQIEGIFTVEVEDPNTRGIRRECRICGMLYELADADWVEPEDDAANSHSSTEANVQQDGNEEIPAPPTSTETLSEAVSNMEIEPSATVQPSSSSVPSLVETSQKPGVAGPIDLTKAPIQMIADTSFQQLDAADIYTGSTDDSVQRQQISGPPHGERYPLPDPPKGYKFRPFLKDSHEAVMALELLSGRYYPRVLDHPLVAERVADAFASDQLSQGNSLWALECLTAGIHNVMDSHKWKVSRHAMMKEAVATAERELTDFWLGGNMQAFQNSNEASDSHQLDVIGTGTNEVPQDISMSSVT